MRFKYIKKFHLFLVAISLILILLLTIPLKLAIACYQQPTPQAILTLGGGQNREEFTAQFAQSHPNLPIWVSTGTDPDLARKIFQDAAILKGQFYLDRRASDTVTNFTTLVVDFKKRHFKHIYLITSDFHMPRAKAIAFLVLGSQGIAFTPVSLATNRKPEPKIKIIRDVGRSIIWIFTKHTGSSLNR